MDHSHIHLSIICGWFHAARAELNVCKRDHTACRAPNSNYLALYRQGLQSPAMCTEMENTASHWYPSSWRACVHKEQLLLHAERRGLSLLDGMIEDVQKKVVKREPTEITLLLSR